MKDKGLCPGHGFVVLVFVVACIVLRLVLVCAPRSAVQPFWLLIYSFSASVNRCLCKTKERPRRRETKNTRKQGNKKATHKRKRNNRHKRNKRNKRNKIVSFEVSPWRSPLAFVYRLFAFGVGMLLVGLLASAYIRLHVVCLLV